MKRILTAFIAAFLLLSVPAPVRADQTDPALTALFDQLKTARNPANALAIEIRIQRIWLRHRSQLASNLMLRVIRQMKAGALTAAADALDVLVDVAPNYAEAWNKRATVRYMLGDLSGSVADIHRTLELEPRHFSALSGMGLILDHVDKTKAALAALEAVRAIHPHFSGLDKRMTALKRKLEGRRI